MHLFSPKAQFPLVPSPSSPTFNFSSNLVSLSLIAAPSSLRSLPPVRSGNSSPAPLQHKVDNAQVGRVEDEDRVKEGLEAPDEKRWSEELLVVRRPVKDDVEDSAVGSPAPPEIEERSGGDQETPPVSKIDRGLSEFAKKMMMFEPERVVAGEKRPLGINLELGLYRAKVLTRKCKFKEAEEILLKVSIFRSFFL